MKPERRSNPRKRPEALAFIDLGPENGGVVVDVSEGGVGFHAAGPVTQVGPFRFWFSLEPFERIEAVGEVAWIDETKKAGGLKFVDIPEAAREKIRAWVCEGAVSATPSGDLAPLLAASRVSPGATTSQPAGEAAFAIPSSPEQKATPTRREAPAIVPSAFSLFPSATEASVRPARAEEPRRVFGPGFFGGFVFGVLTTLAVFAATLLVYLYFQPGGIAQILPGRMAGRQTAPQNPTPAPAAVSSSSHAPLEVVPGGEAKTEGAPPSQVAPSPTPPSATAAAPAEKPAAQTAKSVDIGEAELATAQDFLRGARGGRNAAAAVPWLWAAIRKGNTAAEVVLADLYARGEGVTKSCTQARVLLEAAAKKGNAEAIQKLRELQTQGCP